MSQVYVSPTRGFRSAIVSVLFVVVIFIKLQFWPLAAQKNESCHLRELELCIVGSASFFQNPNGIPSTEKELERQCEYLKESSDCFESFAQRCLTTAQMSTASMFMGGFIDMERQLCGEGKNEFKKRYMKHVDCLKQIQKSHQRPCMTDFQVGFESIHKLNNSIKMTTVCCNSRRLKDCILLPLEEKCGQDAIELVVDLLMHSIGGPFHIICRDYDPSSEVCVQALPAPGSTAHFGRNTSALSRIISSYSNAQA